MARMTASEMMMTMMFFISMLFTPSIAQAPLTSPSSALDCLTATIVNNMGECIPYLMSNSTILSPAVVCCNGLATFLTDDVSCLCQLISFVNVHDRLPLNTTRVTNLSTICNVTPFLFQCQTAPEGPKNIDNPTTSSSATTSKSTVIVRMLLLAPIFSAAIAIF